MKSPDCATYQSCEWRRGFIHLIALTGALVAMGPGRAAGQPGQQGKTTLGALVFRVELRSLEPRAVTVRDGYYVINVVNGLTNGDLAVSVSHSAKGLVARKKIPAGRTKYRELFKLEAGTYTVQAGDRPEWRATITVDKKQ